MAIKVTVSATINAPGTSVWEKWTAPEHIIHWNFAGDDWHCPSAENDLRVGGKYNARMEAKDGSFGFDFITIYDQVVVLEKIAYTMEDGRKAITLFESVENETIVTTVFDAENENPAEMQQQGWQMILNNFKKYAEK
jgi:uncharacterized protein YndB with AHSA1/START domain